MIPEDIEYRLDQAEEIAGLKFDDRARLRQAITHISAVNTSRESNRRLQFLGSGFLKAIAAEHVYHLGEDTNSSINKKWGFGEKSLSTATGRIDRKEETAIAARQLGLHEILIVDEECLRRNIEVQSGCFRAFIGAILLDKGLEVTREKVHIWLIEPITKTKKLG